MKKRFYGLFETSHDYGILISQSPPILHNLRINDKEHKVVISVTRETQ